MTWDVFLLKMDTPIPIEELEDDVKLPQIGDRATVIEWISNDFPDISWGDPSWGFYEAKEYTMEFSLGEENPIGSVIVRIIGDKLPEAVLINFCEKHGLKALDIDGGRYLTSKVPHQNTRDN